MINWEVILWTCVTLAVIMGVIGLILYAISAKNMRNKRKELSEVHTDMKVGSRIMFAGGIYGKIVSMEDEDTLRVEVAPKIVITISRYAVQSIVNNCFGILIALISCTFFFIRARDYHKFFIRQSPSIPGVKRQALNAARLSACLFTFFTKSSETSSFIDKTPQRTPYRCGGFAFCLKRIRAAAPKSGGSNP